MTPSLLLTRPAAAAARFAEEVTRDLEGIETVIAPLIEIRALPLPEMAPPAAVVLASGNAVRAYAQGQPDRPPVFAVGPRTAAAARAEGFGILSEAPDAMALIAAILARPDPGPMLVARGRHVARDIAGALRAAGREVAEAVIYDQAELPPPPAALALIRAPGEIVLPLFSPRSARLALATLGPAARGRFTLAAISPAVAEVAEPLARGRIVVAPQPDGEAMVDIVRAALSGPAVADRPQA
ncbi:uroporphyrinogen-III synthase [Frigidibacter sp. MR17.24]|uniref:uroporphyrinogen-III synthase n=1 Tax=Frigidibacter sp. MR17.24 TaxID=3127345 RepID=UPI003013143A